jgi:hypothetical protein
MKGFCQLLRPLLADLPLTGFHLADMALRHPGHIGEFLLRHPFTVALLTPLIYDIQLSR